MIESKGIQASWTMEDVYELGYEIGEEFYADRSLDEIVGIQESVKRVFKRRGWITKPEWKQAYDEYNNIPEGVFCPKQAKNAISIMHARIVELEKKLDGK